MHTTRSAVIGSLAMCAGAVSLFGAPAAAQRACPSNSPCITQDFQQGRKLIVGWDGHKNWDAYNVRWSRPGREWPQQELSGGRHGSSQLNNTNRGATYTFRVQGCDKHFLSRSTCSPWTVFTITAR
jgi:hypothetical protein